MRGDIVTMIRKQYMYMHGRPFLLAMERVTPQVLEDLWSSVYCTIRNELPEQTRYQFYSRFPYEHGPDEYTNTFHIWDDWEIMKGNAYRYDDYRCLVDLFRAWASKFRLETENDWIIINAVLTVSSWFWEDLDATSRPTTLQWSQRFVDKRILLSQFSSLLRAIKDEDDHFMLIDRRPLEEIDRRTKQLRQRVHALAQLLAEPEGRVKSEKFGMKRRCEWVALGLVENKTAKDIASMERYWPEDEEGNPKPLDDRTKLLDESTIRKGAKEVAEHFFLLPPFGRQKAKARKNAKRET